MQVLKAQMYFYALDLRDLFYKIRYELDRNEFKDYTIQVCKKCDNGYETIVTFY